jgi:hypothetical protein
MERKMALKEINGGYFFRERTSGPLSKLIKRRKIWLSFGKIDLRQAQTIADRIDKQKMPTKTHIVDQKPF